MAQNYELTEAEKKQFESSNAPQVLIESFDGPLDLLLHLIKKNKMDIYDIQIAEITKQYMKIIQSQDLKTLDLDMAGDYLVMASTLAQIKSKMLIPHDEEENAEELPGFEKDPRSELVQKLLEYQRYKEAAANLASSPKFNEDTFKRGYIQKTLDLENNDKGSIDSDSVDLITLVAIFDKMVSNLPEETAHEIEEEKVTITQKIQQVITLLNDMGDDESQRVPFTNLFTCRSRGEIIVTFLSVLELTRLKFIQIYQINHAGEIWVRKNFNSEEIDVEKLYSIESSYSKNIDDDENDSPEETSQASAQEQSEASTEVDTSINNDKEETETNQEDIDGESSGSTAT